MCVNQAVSDVMCATYMCVYFNLIRLQACTKYDCWEVKVKDYERCERNYSGRMILLITVQPLYI